MTEKPNRNELFRLGLDYLLSFEPKGIKKKISQCAKIQFPNFSAMLNGKRPFPEQLRPKVARCLGISERDLERVGMDLTEEIGNSLHMQRVLHEHLVYPEPNEPYNINVYAVNKETRERLLVGKGWAMSRDTYMLEFKEIPASQVEYVIQPRFEVKVNEAPTSEDVDRAEDS